MLNLLIIVLFIRKLKVCFGSIPLKDGESRPGPKVIKLFVLLNSAEHESLNANKYKITENTALLSSTELIMLFFLFTNVKMPTIVGILAFMSRKKNLLVG